MREKLRHKSEVEIPATGDGVHVRRRRCSTLPSESAAAATAERENTLAQFTQLLHEGERVGWGERGEQTQQDHGEARFISVMVI